MPPSYRDSIGIASGWRPGKVDGRWRLAAIMSGRWLEGWGGMLAITPPTQRWQAVGGQAGQGWGGRQGGEKQGAG